MTLVRVLLVKMEQVVLKKVVRPSPVNVLQDTVELLAIKVNWLYIQKVLSVRFIMLYVIYILHIII